MTSGKGQRFNTVDNVFEHWYTEGVTDEFIKASVINHGDENTQIENGDLVISFNFRTDRPREIITVLNQKAIEGYQMKPDRKSTRLNSSHVRISYAVFCLKK